MKKLRITAILAALFLLTLGFASCSGPVTNKTGLNKALNKLNTVKDDSPVTVPKAASSQGERKPGKPFVIDTDYETDSVPVAIYTGADFGAKADGKTDDTAAIQAALNAAAAAGGGTVYLPAGKYLLAGTLTIPGAVTLMGDWASPEADSAPGEGTLLLATANRANPSGAPLFTMKPTAGLKNLSVYYPDQKPGDIKEYPGTISQDIGDSMTVENVTLINPYKGITAGPEWNELHYIHNVYMSPLSVGIFMDYTTDIGRCEKVRISPEYWAESKIAALSDADKAAARDYISKNGKGIIMERSDWEYGYDVAITGYATGMVIRDSASGRGSPNAQFTNYSFKNCGVGLSIEGGNEIGIMFTGSKFESDGGSKAAIMSAGAFQTIAQFNSCVIRGGFETPVLMQASGALTFVNCTFGGYGADKGVYAFDMQNGGATIQQCVFEEGSKHVKAGENTTSLSVLGCTFKGGSFDADISSKAKKRVLHDDTALDLAVATTTEHTYRRALPLPASLDLYNVADYGAVADPAADNTAAFQKALDAAGKTGGTVYIPGGQYGFSGTLTVPAGVELRGVFDVPSHSTGNGSVLFSRSGKGQEEGTPFITLASGAGVRGFQIYYPEQSWSEPVAFPWSVRGAGDNVWAVDVVFVNSYNALDFGTNKSENHYINYVSGSPIRRGIFCGNNSKNGWVENVQFNPHYYARAGFTNLKDDGFTTFWHVQIKNLDAFIFGYNKSEHYLGNFVYAANRGLYFIEQDGKSTNGTFIGHGSDGGTIAMYVEQLDVVQMINTELVAMEAEARKSHLRVDKGFKGTVALINSLVWGPTDESMVIDGGNVIIQQCNYLESGDFCFAVNGGSADITSCYTMRESSHGSVAEAAEKVRILGNIRKKQRPRENATGESFVVDNQNGEDTAIKNNWWK